MKLTKEQAELLADLSGQIQDKYGLIIGYTNPHMPMPPVREADFIIFEKPEGEQSELPPTIADSSLHCFYKADIKTRPVGNFMVSVVPDEPEHDEKVEKLLERINNDLLDGKIWFDPGVAREEDGLRIEVTKKSFPGADEDVYDTNIFTERYGVVYTYEFIAEAAHQDKRFRIAKKIIDEVWPQTPKEPEVKAPTAATLPSILSKILKLFGV